VWETYAFAVAPPLQLFEGLSWLYRAQMMDPWWRWYSEEPGPRRALALFTGEYAYERQGRARSYPHAAYFAVEECRALDAAEIWQAFQDELDGAKSNPRLNPLNHSAVRCTCVRCIFTDSDGELQDVVDVTRSDLVDGHVGRAFQRLDLVRGIGPKIASFFLRDLAVWFKIEPLRDRELLQPIDVWVRRYVVLLNNGAAVLTDQQTADWICGNSVAPEAANQGLWYFASQIAGSEVKMRRALADERYANELVKGYVDQLRGAVTAWTSRQVSTEILYDVSFILCRRQVFDIAIEADPSCLLLWQGRPHRFFAGALKAMGRLAANHS
jgi:hypothetical protein